MQVLKFVSLSVVVLFVLVGLVVIVRKLAYEFYRVSFSDAHRVQKFTSDIKFSYYWRSRADRLPGQTLRLYCAWIMQRFDCYIPIIDCERQAAKAEYFYEHGWNVGMRTFHFRSINPKAWPIFLLRSFVAVLLSPFTHPKNRQLDNFEKRASRNQSGNK